MAPKGSTGKKKASPAKASPAPVKSTSSNQPGKSPPINLEKSANSNFLTVAKRNMSPHDRTRTAYLSVWVVRGVPKASCIALSVLPAQIGDPISELTKNCWAAKVLHDMAAAAQFPLMDFNLTPCHLCLQNDEVLNNTGGYPIRVEIIPTGNPPEGEDLKMLMQWVCDQVNENRQMQGRIGYAGNRIVLGDRWLVNDNAVYSDFLTSEATVAFARVLFDIDSVENWGSSTLDNAHYSFYRRGEFPLFVAQQLGVRMADVLPEERTDDAPFAEEAEEESGEVEAGGNK